MSYQTFTNSAAPAAPGTGKTTQYVDASGQPAALNSTGVLNRLAGRAAVNFIRNGGFWFAQRQSASAAVTYSSATARLIGADGWGTTCENASCTYQRTDTASAPDTDLQSQFYGNFLKITSTGKLQVTQVIEGKDTCQIRGRTVRVQAWIKGLVLASQTVKIALVQLNSSGTIDSLPATFISAHGANGVDPTLGTNLAYIAPKSGVTGDNCAAGTNAYSATVTTSWQRFGGVFDVPTTCKNLVVMFYSDNQLLATNGFALAQVSLTDGYEIQDWAPMPYQNEYDRVLRFYCKTFNVDTAPVQNALVGTGEFRFIAGTAGAGAERSPTYLFPVPMRVAPTTNTTYNPAAANAQVRDITAGGDCTVAAIGSATEKGCYITATGNAGTVVGGHLGVHLTFDAEL